MLQYMFDTDTSSYIMKRSNSNLLQRLRQVPVADACISAIVRSELVYGLAVSPHPSRDQAALDEYLRQILVLDFPSDAAIEYGAIRADLKRSGTMIGANDLFIAAHARFLGLTLVTNNTREFSRVPGLKIENWA